MNNFSAAEVGKKQNSKSFPQQKLQYKLFRYLTVFQLTRITVFLHRVKKTAKIKKILVPSYAYETFINTASKITKSREVVSPRIAITEMGQVVFLL